MLRLRKVLVVFSLALSAGVGGGSCKIDDGGDEEGGTGGPTCTGCSSSTQWGDCVCFTGPNDRACWSDASCTGWCVDQTGMGGNFQPIVCADEPDSGSCSGWDPTSEVRLVSGIRRVDDVWLAALVDNPAPLWTCDDALLNDVNGGGFKVEQANSGELLYQLGLRNNDVPLTLNTMPLRTVDDGLDAFQQLYLQGVTSYTLQVRRGTNNITLSYLID